MADKKFLKIDLHTHILPKHWPDLSKKYGYGGWLQLQHTEPGKADMIQDGKNFRTIDCNCWSPEQRIKECNDTGVDVQVLSTVPVMFSYWAKPEHTLDLARYLNDHIAQTVAEDPKRFIGLGTLPMQAPELAVQELRRCVNELGLKGVQIGSHVNEWNLDAPELAPIFAAAEELDCAIFVHPWNDANEVPPRMKNYWFPWLIGMPCETTMAVCSLVMGGVMERHPNLKVAFAHGGGSFVATLGRIQHGFDVRPDLCATKTKIPPIKFLDRIYIDSLVHDIDTLKFLIKKLGPNRIMLGSDYPFPLGEHEPGKMIEESDLDDEVKEKLLSGNVLKWLGLDKDQFLLEGQ
ncbi:2-amino-3-carboxymuconate-6-semialdehyde decarboxylase-like protein [Paraphysoderma sedebokerense]|nr:2-amino-3-carboxymuconate-6-semialdehyde decarboxylase-like protein [Paraphysoderma sedebokerense]